MYIYIQHVFVSFVASASDLNPNTKYTFEPTARPLFRIATTTKIKAKKFGFWSLGNATKGTIRFLPTQNSNACTRPINQRTSTIFNLSNL